jgi:hypothetical protein
MEQPKYVGPEVLATLLAVSYQFGRMLGYEKMLMILAR